MRRRPGRNSSRPANVMSYARWLVPARPSRMRPHETHTYARGVLIAGIWRHTTQVFAVALV